MRAGAALPTVVIKAHFRPLHDNTTMPFEMGSPVDLLGYTASALVLLAFSLRSLVALRAVAIASNLAFIGYALAAQLPPVLLLHAALLPVNVWRLWEQKKVGTANAKSR